MTRSVHSIVFTALLVAAAGAVALPVVAEAPQQRSIDAPQTGPGQAPQLNSEAPRGRWHPDNGTGEIILDDESYYEVFQGERDIDAWRNATGDDVSGTILEGEVGESEGDVLELGSAVPDSQDVGRYAGSDLTVRVQEPEIESVDLYNSIGTELDSMSELRRDEPLLVVADWNFVAAEDLRVELIDRDGDVTIQREVLSTSPTDEQADRLPDGFDEAALARETQGTGTTGYESAYWLFDVEELDEGSYTLRIEGVDDLTAGEAVETIDFTVGTEETGTPTDTETATATDTATATPPETSSSTPTATLPATTETPQGPGTASPSAPTTAPTPSPTTGDDGPGFGFGVTLVAVCIAVLYARHTRR